MRPQPHQGFSDEPHGSISPSLSWHLLPAEMCQLLGGPFQPRAVLRTGIQCQWSGCAPVPPALLQGAHRESHMVAFPSVSAVDHNLAYFNQKASLSMVLKCVLDARILGGFSASQWQ